MLFDDGGLDTGQQESRGTTSSEGVARVVGWYAIREDGGDEGTQTRNELGVLHDGDSLGIVDVTVASEEDSYRRTDRQPDEGE